MKSLSKHRNFLSSAEIRDLTPYDLSQRTEEECHQWLAIQRFGNLTNFGCPKCGVIDSHYYRAKRRQWRCRGCDGTFSCTTGTPFQDRKLPFKKLLLSIAYFVNAANGISCVRLSHDVDVQVKTALALLGKLREANARCFEKMSFSGSVEVDGGHFGGRPRSGRVRRKPSASDIAARAQSLINFQNGIGPKPKAKISAANRRRLKKRRIAFVMRRHTGRKGFGADKTFVFIVRAETATEVLPYIREYVAPGSTIMTDESNAYHGLSSDFTHHSVNHQLEYSTKDGYNENQAESFFSRLRRYYLGVGHKSEPKYMLHIAMEMAWREDVRRLTQREKFASLTRSIFTSGLSRLWRGYWQGAAKCTTETMVIKSSGLAW